MVERCGALTHAAGNYPTRHPPAHALKPFPERVEPFADGRTRQTQCAEPAAAPLHQPVSYPVLSQQPGQPAADHEPDGERSSDAESGIARSATRALSGAAVTQMRIRHRRGNTTDSFRTGV